MTLKLKTPPMPEPDFTLDWRGLYTADQLAARDAQWLALVGPVVEALNACIKYGAMTGDEWVKEEARAALRAITEEQE